MTDTATEKDATETLRRGGSGKPRYMSALERQQLLREIAVGRPLWVLASRYGKSYEHIRRISSECKEEIAEIRRELGDEMNILWAQDMTYRAMELQHSIEKTRQQQRRLEQEATEFSDSTGLGSGVVSEHWHKLDAHAAKLIHMLGEMLGQLPTRTPPVMQEGSKMTYEVKGVDVHETVKDWMNQAQGS